MSKEKVTCKFDKAWIGACGLEVVQDGYCEKHSEEKCCVCKEQATHDCEHTGQFVCGYPLCAKCEGWNDGTKSAWGFIGHKHRKKKLDEEEDE